MVYYIFFNQSVTTTVPLGTFIWNRNTTQCALHGAFFTSMWNKHVIKFINDDLSIDMIDFTNKCSDFILTWTSNVQVRDMWKSVDDFYSSQTDEREVVESILRGTLDKHKLDASSLNITVPDRLLTECEKQIQAVCCFWKRYSTSFNEFYFFASMQTWWGEDT